MHCILASKNFPVLPSVTANHLSVNISQILYSDRIDLRDPDIQTLRPFESEENLYHSFTLQQTLSRPNSIPGSAFPALHGPPLGIPRPPVRAPYSTSRPLTSRSNCQNGRQKIWQSLAFRLFPKRCRGAIIPAAPIRSCPPDKDVWLRMQGDCLWHARIRTAAAP